jgi:hypothetical protein
LLIFNRLAYYHWFVWHLNVHCKLYTRLLICIDVLWFVPCLFFELWCLYVHTWWSWMPGGCVHIFVFKLIILFLIFFSCHFSMGKIPGVNLQRLQALPNAIDALK